ncbi:MAG: hypothetical protein RJA22_2831 [Verrucomicrobiota bacterium]|jgi:sarcosine oxidase
MNGPDHEVIIVGLGAMGSAAAFHLARRGVRVLGLDRFAPPHDRGSSHGQTRIIREAYFEDPVYVPLVRRAYELWAELARESGRDLLRVTGGLMLGDPDSVIVAGARRSAEEHGLPHEVLGAAEVRRRFPALRPVGEMVGVLEPRAGVLFPHECIAAHLDLARRHGADLRLDEAVRGWAPDGAGVRVETARGTFRARRLVLTAGAWVAQLLPGMAVPFQVERQVLHWFEAIQPADFAPDRCPVHLWQFDGMRFFYGFPDLGEGVKLAFHHDGETTTAEGVRREVAEAEVEAMRRVMRRFLPGANGAWRASTVCVYTNTPDEHFWIDQHPGHPQVIVGSPCSGHGFKFSAAVGEVLADLAQDVPPRVDLGRFRWR